MSDANIKMGMVGFFDILGYKNLLKKNEPEIIAQNVIPIITELGSSIKISLNETFKGDKSFKSIVDSMECLIYSDTILVALPIGDDYLSNKDIYWGTFLIACVELQGKLFKSGLPTRGAVDFGSFYIKGNCFAGRAIINAYELSIELNLSAAILSDTAVKEVNSIVDNAGIFHGTFLKEYLIPFKDKEEQRITIMAHTFNQDKPDIHNTVLNAFWGINKDISSDARIKANNTEQWLEYLVALSKNK